MKDYTTAPNSSIILKRTLVILHCNVVGQRAITTYKTLGKSYRKKLKEK